MVRSRTDEGSLERFFREYNDIIAEQQIADLKLARDPELVRFFELMHKAMGVTIRDIQWMIENENPMPDKFK